MRIRFFPFYLWSWSSKFRIHPSFIPGTLDSCVVGWLKSAFCVTLIFSLLRNLDMIVSVELQEEMRSWKAGSWKAGSTGPSWETPC